MELDLLKRYLDEPTVATPWLQTLRLTKTKSGHDNLRRIAEAGVSLDLVDTLCEQFKAAAPTLADADMAWNNLERFIVAARSPLATVALFERDRSALPNLLSLFASSQYLSDLLVRDQECYDLLRMTEGRPVARDVLVEEITGEVLVHHDINQASRTLRRCKRRETLRIAYGDIVRGQVVSTVARQISFLADALIEAALAFLRRQLVARYGEPRDAKGDPVRYCVLALGKLGGIELNYSSDIDLVLLYDHDGQTSGPRPIENREFFDRLSRELVKLLSEQTEFGAVYRVDLRLRPEGTRGPLCPNLEQMIAYYDVKGRTWERQAYVKARAVAGDISLGDELLRRLEPWVYRRYLSLADITGIKSLKARIEHRTLLEEGGERNVKNGPGGIRDIEFVIQFLQLLNGGTLPEVRTGNTLEAVERLAKAGCLTHQEATLLSDNYSFLRKVEHRLQIMFDLQTHTLPAEPDELRKLAVRMGYVGTPHRLPLDMFRGELRERTETNRKMLDHLLSDAFGGDPTAEPEVDLVNDPSPSFERIEEVLGKYQFEDAQNAYDNLMELATERIRFLSTRRCRHFLASIAPRLLTAISRTPDPDGTLVSLCRVSDSLGGKAALWELFSSSQASLQFYVKLCAACPYLSSILTSNPGMIDELMDSLLVENLPTLAMLETSLAELVRGAEDLSPILLSFKSAQHLRVGVRDIVGKDDIRDTHAALSDIAECCLKAIIEREYQWLVDKFGEPTIGEMPEPTAENMAYRSRFAERVGERSELVVLALGKLGGREPNYHSDLDLIFLYEAEGQTFHRKRGKTSGLTTTNGHFFSELGQRIIKVANQIGPLGRLYEVDMRLRPAGKSSPLAAPIDSLARYFASGRGQLWERQTLCKARVIFGAHRAAAYAMHTVVEAAYGPAWKPEMAREIREMRARLEESATPANLKRGPGGAVDTEFLVQMLQLKHGHENPAVRVPGTLDALTALEEHNYLSSGDAQFFRQAYRFQRSVEARIRLMNAAGRHEFPSDPAELAKLAYLLRGIDPTLLQTEALEIFAETRERFERLFAAAAES